MCRLREAHRDVALVVFLAHVDDRRQRGADLVEAEARAHREVVVLRLAPLNLTPPDSPAPDSPIDRAIADARADIHDRVEQRVAELGD